MLRSKYAQIGIAPARRSYTAQEIIATYRALLRAAGYLPDSFARKYAYERIKSRFRASRNQASKAARKHNTILIDASWTFTKQRLQKARQVRRQMENAGNGDMDALKRILMIAHGRQGERKRMLLNYLLRPDEETLPKNASELQYLIDKPVDIKQKVGLPSQKVYDFIKSQQENQPVEVQKDKLRHLKPKIPEENIWGRPMPVKLKLSMQRKWWANTLEKILPPIPRSEWERLRDLATAAVPLEASPVRRKAVQIEAEEPSADKKTREMLQFFQASARAKSSKSYEFNAEKGLQASTTDGLEKSITGWSKLRATKEKGQEVEERSKADSPAQLADVNPRTEHDVVENVKLRSRSLRRLYASIWSMSPTMAYDEVSKKWDITWGGQKSRALEGVVAKPTEAERELFEGIDAIPRGPSAVAGDAKPRNRDVRRTLKEEASERAAREKELDIQKE